MTWRVQYSRGSKLFSVSGDTPKPGIYELELGMSLIDFVDEFGDGDTKAVQVGGASGFLVPRKRFGETAIGFQGKTDRHLSTNRRINDAF